MRLLTNPLFLSAIMLLVVGGGSFIIGVLLIRRMKQELVAKHDRRAARSADSPAFALATYNAVIQQLKEKEQELQRLRHAAAEKASATENVSAAVIDNLPSGVVLFNTSALVQQANPAAREILGYASATGLHARDLFRGAGRPEGELAGLEVAMPSLEAVIDSCLKQGRVFRRLTAEYMTPAGVKRVLGVTVSPFARGAGERIGAACLLTDLTEVVTLAQQLRLRESLAALGEMSAGIAHEFKNSLATISGYGQMLASESDAESIRQFAARITKETAVLSRTVSDFLSFARPQELARQPVFLEPLLAECASGCGVELDVAGLPPQFTVTGDPIALRQCFDNLLRNSAEAAADRKVRVAACATIGESNIRIELRDDAGGIPADVLPRIFIPFVTTKAQGNGLGLALAHRIVTDHGGSITATNESGGALFILSFPMEKLAKTVGQRS